MMDAGVNWSAASVCEVTVDDGVYAPCISSLTEALVQGFTGIKVSA